MSDISHADIVASKPQAVMLSCSIGDAIYVNFVIMLALICVATWLILNMQRRVEVIYH